MLALLILILIILPGGAVFTMVVKKKQASDTVNKFWSLGPMIEKLFRTVKRFPITVLLLVGLAIRFRFEINSGFDTVFYRLWVFLPGSIFISVAVTLFIEDFYSKLKTYAISLLAVLLWGVYCLFLPETVDEMLISKNIEFSVLGAAAFFAILFIPFLKKNTDRAFWNFSTYTLFQMVLAYAFGGVLFGGLSFALFAIDNLFAISVSNTIYANLAVVCLVLFSPLYLLSNIPAKAEKYRDEIFYTKIQKVLLFYILTPILAVYGLILYFYLLKIIISWELPNGWVSWLVSAFAQGGLLVIALSYPIREQENNKLATFISRWLGVLILPLLALMTIGILRRIGDYGITINRGYILLLNLWFYGIYIYLYRSQSRHIKWILISPVILACCTSISFWSVANVTQKSLNKEIRAVWPQKVSSMDARAILAKMTENEKERMRSTLEYLYQYFGRESVQLFFTDSVPDNRWSFFSEMGLDIMRVQGEEMENIHYSTDDDKVWTVGDYNTFAQIGYYKTLYSDTIQIPMPHDTVEVPVRKIALEYLASKRERKAKWSGLIQEDNYTIVIRSLYGQYYPAKDSLSVSTIHAYFFCHTENE
ncbi:DUF4153 domain-containing protein [Porphyromonadaceae bacterium OttesenSCG-928-L07]|nr:DUF4153 domain-containing protein [Porphyromonadaceae bacterium OttesenSCG-928-L07]MDL2331095.1 DUF4153 domain-containing protein [Odoribacter sp. OttesenSCG-928-A06]